MELTVCGGLFKSSFIIAMVWMFLLAILQSPAYEHI